VKLWIEKKLLLKKIVIVIIDLTLCGVLSK
jgi:hypothetical protein